MTLPELYITRKYHEGWHIISNGSAIEDISEAIEYLHQKQAQTGIAIPPVEFEKNWNAS